MSKSKFATRPCRGIAPWFGGKSMLAERLIARIEAVPHQCYAEPFVGAGGVFLRRRHRAKVEVINDRNTDIVRLFRVLKAHPFALLDALRLGLHARSEFDRLLEQPLGGLTDVELAARFLILQRARFGGRPDGSTFNSGPRHTSRNVPYHFRRDLVAIHRRLMCATIEALDFAAFIERYDRPETMFYLDPPYWGCEKDYGAALFERADFDRLAGILKQLRGRFVLSLNDRPDVRARFAWAQIEEVPVSYSVSAAGGRRATELIITG